MSVLNQLPDDLKAPPAWLSPKSQEKFLHIVASGFYDAPARALLIQWLRIGDELEAADADIRQKGCDFTDRWGQERERPISKRRQNLWNEYGKYFRLLGWDQAPPDMQGAFSFMGPQEARGPVSHATH